MTEIKWQEPPASAHGRSSSKWRDIFTALAERPGEWALVAEDAPLSTSSNIKRGTLGGPEFRRGDFEATARKRPGGKYDIYARYVGGVA